MSHIVDEKNRHDPLRLFGGQGRKTLKREAGFKTQSSNGQISIMHYDDMRPKRGEEVGYSDAQTAK